MHVNLIATTHKVISAMTLDRQAWLTLRVRSALVFHVISSFVLTCTYVPATCYVWVLFTNDFMYQLIIDIICSNNCSHIDLVVIFR